MKFEYIVLGESSLKTFDCKNYLELFNKLGESGWEYCAPYQGNNFLFKRRISFETP
jgi:hypothetical protein